MIVRTLECGVQSVQGETLILRLVSRERHDIPIVTTEAQHHQSIVVPNRGYRDGGRPITEIPTIGGQHKNSRGRDYQDIFKVQLGVARYGPTPGDGKGPLWEYI